MEPSTSQRRFRLSRKELDEYFPTLVRYMGIGVVVVYVGAALFGKHLPESILVAATGLILYKTVRGNGNGDSS